MAEDNVLPYEKFRKKNETCSTVKGKVCEKPKKTGKEKRVDARIKLNKKV